MPAKDGGAIDEWLPSVARLAAASVGCSSCGAAKVGGCCCRERVEPGGSSIEGAWAAYDVDGRLLAVAADPRLDVYMAVGA